MHLKTSQSIRSNPKLSDLTIYSNNSRNNSLATSGNNLNITITANETLKAANVTVFGITHVMILNNMTASANVTIDENTTEGYVFFNITAFDLAGNSLTVNQTNLNSSNLTIDRTNALNVSDLNHIQQQPPQHLTCNIR